VDRVSDELLAVRKASPSAAAWGFGEGDEIAPRRLAVRLLGGGERYETYLAWDERLHALVVVKVGRPNLVEDEHSLRGLAAEADLVERLNHPVIVRGFDAVLDGPRPHLGLEHLEGPRLSRVLRKQGTLGPEQLLPLGLQLASALHYLEEERVVHLDVKPSNVILGAPARLIDLSIARSVHELETVTHRIGTDAYMAPEQCDPKRLGPMRSAADVWGMGATLFHGAAGTPAFQKGARGYPRGALPAAPGGTGAASVHRRRRDCRPDRRLPRLRVESAPRGRRGRPGVERLVTEQPQRPVLSRFRIRPRL
jgi:serine/threonine protein kinase